MFYHCSHRRTGQPAGGFSGGDYFRTFKRLRYLYHPQAGRGLRLYADDRGLNYPPLGLTGKTGIGGRLTKNFATKVFSIGFWLIVSAIFLLTLPLFLQASWVSLINEMLIMALAGTALNLMLGYGGMVSFGPAGLYAVGASTTLLLLTRYGLPFPLAVLAAPLAAAAVGLLVGWFCVRRSAVYFALLTLAFAQIIWTVIFEWYGFTGGDNGIVSIPIPEFFFTIIHCYYFTLIVVGISLLLLWMIVQSPFGKTLQAIRENPGRTEFIAIHLKRYQLAAFVLSSAFLGIAGSLYCVFSG